MASEQELLPKYFAFNHISYSRYLTFQLNVWNDLLREGFGGSLSGEQFSIIPGDLTTEVTINHEVKVCGGRMMSGSSTPDQTNDTFIKISHVMTKVRSKLK